MPDSKTSLLNRLTKAPLVADQKRAKAQLEDFVGRVRDEPEAASLLQHLDEGLFRDLLLGIADHSPFLWRLAVNDPARVARLAFTAPEETHRAIVENQTDLFRALRAGAMTRDEVGARVPAEPQRSCAARGARRYRRHLETWSRSRRLSPTSPMPPSRGGVNLVLTEMADLGRINLQDPDRPGEGSGFTVLALGKHGAGELNYSSDIDLVVFFDPETTRAAARLRGARRSIPASRSSSRKLLQERTADGYVHRVDYRLRPDPGSTPTAVSLASAYTYYETVGQNWERAALIKARPVAGDIALGETLSERAARPSSGASISTSPPSPTCMP